MLENQLSYVFFFVQYALSASALTILGEVNMIHEVEVPITIHLSNLNILEDIPSVSQIFEGKINLEWT